MRSYPPAQPVVILDRSLVAWWLGACVVGSALWVAIGLGVCSLVGWC